MASLVKIVGTGSTLALLLCSTAAAQEIYTIDGPTNITNGGATLDGDDTIIVTPIGSVTTITPFGIGLFGNGDRNTLINNGTIATGADGAHGLYAQGSSNTVTNTGTVATSGDGAHGLFGNGSGNTLNNSGTVTTGGAGAFGLYVQGDENTLSNSGAVVTQADGANGLFANGNSNTLDNSGTVETAGAGAFGVYAQGDNNALSNSGGVTTLANGTHGLFANGGSNVLTNSGTVETNGTGAFGLYAQGDNNTLSNSGAVVTQADGAHGLFGNGAFSTLRNVGSVETNGAGAFALYAQGSDNMLGNSGTIATGGNGAHGLFANGDANDLSNDGSIQTGGAGAFGVYAQGADNTLSNRGMITTVGNGTYGLFANGGSNMSTNSGTILTSGDGAIGFFANGDDNTLTNDGNVSTSGAGAHGLVVNGLNASVTNSGSILSANGYSISFTGDTNSTLHLLQGSVLQGDVHFDDPTSATLSFGPGLSAVVRIDGGVPAAIMAPNDAFAVDGTTIYAVDAGSFIAADRAVGDVGGLVLDALDARLSYQGLSPSVTQGASSGPNAWGQSFGAYRDQGSNATAAPYYGSTAGFMLGWDLDNQRGLFVGIARSRDNSANSFDLASNQIFAGYHASYNIGGVATDAALTFGTAWNASERTVANNMVAGGLETASASFNSYYIMPSVRFSGDLPVAQGTLTPSARLRYAAIHQEGFTESGSAANLAVDSRTSHLLAARLQLDRGLAPQATQTGTLFANMRLGVDLQYLDGDTIHTTLTGPLLDVVLPGDDTFATRGFVGLDLRHVSDDGRHEFNGGVEIGQSNDALTDMRANLRWTLRF